MPSMKIIIVLAGLPGAGKSSLAARLADRSGYSILSRDTIKRALFGKLNVSPAQNDHAFSVLLDTLPTVLNYAPGVIVDGLPFSRVGQAESVEAVAMAHGALSLTFLLDCDTQTAMERLILDNRSDPVLVSRVVAEFREIPDHWIRIDALQTPSEIEAHILSILNSMEDAN